MSDKGDKGQEGMAHLLNSSQRNSLAVVLNGFEKDLREAAVWLRSGGVSGMLYERTLALPPENRAEALALIEQALAEIGRLAAALELRPTAEDLSRRIAAMMSLNWVNLVDVRADKLRRYGAVDPALGEVLDPRVERLAELALAISALMGKPPG